MTGFCSKIQAYKVAGSAGCIFNSGKTGHPILSELHKSAQQVRLDKGTISVNDRICGKVIQTEESSSLCPIGYFPCGNQSVCLPLHLRCNGVEECENGTDESNCVDKVIQTEESSTLCTSGYFQCGNQSVCLPLRLRCNGFEECENGTDESNCVIIKRERTSPFCPSGYFPCGNETVCLPQTLHCNGIEDCENGGDESNCDDLSGWPQVMEWYMTQLILVVDSTENCTLTTYPSRCTCQGMSAGCNSLGLLTMPTFSSNLAVLLLQYNLISTISKKSFWGLYSLTKLILSHNRISVLEPGLFKDLHHLEWLILDNNMIRSVTRKSFDGLKLLFFLYLTNNSLDHVPNVCREIPNLRWLDLEGNNIVTIEKAALEMCTSLSVLDLSANMIEEFPPTFFRGLRYMQLMNLSGNPINHLHVNQFDDLASLRSLDLDNIDSLNIETRMFKKVERLAYIYFKKFEYCKYSPNVRSCKPNTDGISSFENLLASTILRIFVWFVAFIICFGNFFVICMRSFIKTENRLHTLSIKSLCCADCLMGVYLFLIGAFDVKYRGEYNKHAQQWMESTKCQLIGALAMLSTEVSVMLLTYMTLEKYMCIVFPFNHYRPGKRQTMSTLILIWIAGFIIAIIPLWNKSLFGNYYGKNGVCFPLYSDQFENLGARGYSTGIFLGLNLLAFIIIVFSYTSMFYSIHKTGAQSAERSFFSREVAIAKRFFFIVFTDFLCWIPIFLLKILSLLRVEIPGNVTSWVVIFILPINSALNPILYTITTASFQEKLKQCLQSQDFLGPTKSLTSSTQTSNV
ncbi:relaxin receptor 2-like [Amblyraja radiata]|uniref:relaxin receptor 2-like n=1 Tax=Amblyraja radiata TaxID=386614 RepID=UPI001402D193|nr:relaxin receptor 2-like [Amblyraja radiata]